MNPAMESAIESHTIAAAIRDRVMVGRDAFEAIVPDVLGQRQEIVGRGLECEDPGRRDVQ